MRNKSNPTKLNQKIKEKGVFPESIYEVNINASNNPDQGITRKEDQRPINLTNIGAKIHYKILANLVQQYTKIFTKWGLSQKCVYSWQKQKT